jgi:hypothetical protein
MYLKKWILTFIVICFQTQLLWASDDCATNESGLTGNLRHFNRLDEWYETTASDRRPLKVIVNADESRVFLSFEKSDVAIRAPQNQFLSQAANADYTLWGEGPIEICQNGSNYKIKFLEGARATSDAPGVMRSNFRVGAEMNLTVNSTENSVRDIRIGAGFWNSTLVPVR